MIALKIAHRCVIWKSPWNLEGVCQAAGRCARKPGQVGEARLITWHYAVQQAAKYDPEFGELASNPATFFDNVFKRLDYDTKRPWQFQLVTPGKSFDFVVETRKILYSSGTWKLNPPPRKLMCFICMGRHLTRSCPDMGIDDVPHGFCYACLLPTWKIDGICAVHHPTNVGWQLCENTHRATTRELFFLARLRHHSIPASVTQMVSEWNITKFLRSLNCFFKIPTEPRAAWRWLFEGQIPGVLRMHLQMHKEKFERTRCI